MSKILPDKIFLILFIGSIFFLLSANLIFAQISSSAIAVPVPVVDTEVQDGDIICTYKEGNKRCSKSYDPAIFGVVSLKPAAFIEDKDIENSKLVVTSGITQVRVSSINGDIKEGDFITSSENPGVGQKATRNGFVLGVALEGYQSNDPKKEEKILVLVNIHPSVSLSGPRGDLLQFIRQGIAVPVFEPVESLRYILASLMIVIAFTLGMVYFGKSSRSGIEAIGRNPLARKVIQFTVVLNIILTIVIVLVGLGIAYLILIL